MHRIEGEYNEDNLFVDGPPGTILTDDWLNAVQEEFAYVIEQSGAALKTADSDNRTQLYTAIDSIIDAAVSLLPSEGTQIMNLIYNGAMNVAQRRQSNSTGINSTGYYVYDLWEWAMNGTGIITMGYSSTVPSGEGFANSLQVDVTTADAALAAAEYYEIRQKIEAQRLQHLNYGSSDAEDLTLSFWVRSNLTGNFGGYVHAPDGSRVFPFGYTINAVDTFEQKTITITGDTAGTINNDSGIGLMVVFGLGHGSNYTSGTKDTWQADGGGGNYIDSTYNTNVLNNVANELFVTGVQLELGDTAGDFSNRSFAEELQFCQRYFCKSYDYDVVPGTIDSNGAILEPVTRNNANLGLGGDYPITMRANPTVTLYATGSGNSGNVTNGGDKVAAATRIGFERFGHVSITGGATASDASYHFVASADL